MFPVLLTIGKFSLSSYGLFLILAFLLGIFLTWRLSRAWDLDEEKTLDIALLTIIGSLFGARLIFIIEHFSAFASAPLNILLIHKMPGFSFLGGIFFGVGVMYYLARRLSLDFWLIVDIASVGFLGGLSLSSIGCLLGGCNIGSPSQSFFAISIVGVIGKRWPVQILESALFLFVLFKVWKQTTHFHQRGKIAALALIYFGVIKILLDPLREDHFDRFIWLLTAVLGLLIYYRVAKQNPINIFKTFLKSFTLQNFIKTCYNQKTSIAWKIRSFKKIFKRTNVKSNRKNSRIY